MAQLRGGRQPKQLVLHPAGAEEGTPQRELSYPATPASSVRSGAAPYQIPASQLRSPGGSAYLDRPSVGSAEQPLRAGSTTSSAAVSDDMEVWVSPRP